MHPLQLNYMIMVVVITNDVTIVVVSLCLLSNYPTNGALFLFRGWEAASAPNISSFGFSTTPGALLP